MTDPLRPYLEQIAGRMPDKDWEVLRSILRPSEVLKGRFLLEEGMRCGEIWFLVEGAVRYFENVDGEHRTTHFFTAPAMFTSYHSLISGAPSEVNILAEAECRILSLPYDRLKEGYDQSHVLERIGRIMAEYQFIAEFNRRRMLLHMDALERYEKLEEEHPEVFQHFQLKDIATYLGITPVSLSRLRKYRAERGK